MSTLPPFDLVVATTNLGKMREIRAYLSDWNCLLPPLDLLLTETGETFAENACQKATQAALALEAWVLADDSGLEVDSLDGAPGVFSARYGRTDAERIQRLLFELGDERERGAQFVCAVAVANPQGKSWRSPRGLSGGNFIRTRGTGGLAMTRFFMSRRRG
jgi:non-canonical purine NTP pyrophosphatase, rdgB/HAM1 family